MTASAPAGTPLLDVRGVTLQYKTRDHLVTATYRVDFQVFRSDRYILLGRRVAASPRC
jgi:NitT/TauT family transport system ATP-binding protein